MTPKLEYLSYFLDTYWNQMGPELYSSIEQAAVDFASESREYVEGLLKDLETAEKAGVLGVDYRDQAYSGPYWNQFDMIIDKKDASIVRRVLESCRKSGREW